MASNDHSYCSFGGDNEIINPMADTSSPEDTGPIQLPAPVVDESNARDFDPVQLPPPMVDTSKPSSSGAVQLSTPRVDPKCSGDLQPPSLCPPLKRFDLYNGLLNEGCSLAPKAPAKDYQNKVELKILQHLGFESRAELSDDEAKTLETKCKSFTNKARQLWASPKVRQIKGNMNKEKWLQENFEFGNLKDTTMEGRDQMYQSITCVGTLLLQIGEVGQRVKGDFILTLPRSFFLNPH